jgi:hypothetical protein
MSTSTTIHNTSCHPVEHKQMAFNFLLYRLNTYPLNNSDMNNELQIINQMARENEYYPTNSTFKFNVNITEPEPPSTKL